MSFKQGFELLLDTLSYSLVKTVLHNVDARQFKRVNGNGNALNFAIADGVYIFGLRGTQMSNLISDGDFLTGDDLGKVITEAGGLFLGRSLGMNNDSAIDILTSVALTLPVGNFANNTFNK